MLCCPTLLPKKMHSSFCNPNCILLWQDTTSQSLRKSTSCNCRCAASTLFCLRYGQTSTGKTHTMLGVDVWRLAENTSASPALLQASTQRDGYGLIPRSLESIFDNAAQESTVSASYLEIYNEAIFDLLAETPSDRGARGLGIVASSDGAVSVPEAVTMRVRSAADVLAVLWKGARNRSLASTDMNEHSSRSHTIFMVHIDQPAPAKAGAASPGESRILSKVCFVDLAGSEKIQAHQLSMTPSRMSELTAINQSLSCLGRCIRALTTKGTSGHVPYRESKLTRLLQDSLGGNTRTAFFVTLSPSMSAVEESLSTLAFADRAKQVVVHAKVNRRASAEEELAGLRSENAKLKRLLAQGGSASAAAAVASRRSSGSSEGADGDSAGRQATLLLARQVQQLKGELTESEAGRRHLVNLHTYSAQQIDAAKTIHSETQTLARLRSQVLAYHKELATVLSANEDLKNTLGEVVQKAPAAAVRDAALAQASQVAEMEQRVAASRQGFVDHVAVLQEQTSRLTTENTELTSRIQMLQKHLAQQQAAGSAAGGSGGAAGRATAPASPAPDAMQAEEAKLWTHHVDKKRMRSYWHNKQDGSTTWHRPEALEHAVWVARRRKLGPALEDSRSELLETLAGELRDSFTVIAKASVGSIMQQSGVAGEADLGAVWERLAPGLDAVLSERIQETLQNVNRSFDLLAATMELR